MLFSLISCSTSGAVDIYFLRYVGDFVIPSEVRYMGVLFHTFGCNFSHVLEYRSFYCIVGILITHI